MRNIAYLSWITYSLIISGYLVSMIFPQSSVVGYSCVVAGLFTLIILRLVPLTQVPSITYKTFLPHLSLIMVLGICCWLLAINVKFSKNIRSGHVTSEYNTFNIINFILLMAQLIVIKLKNFEFTTSVVSFLLSFQIVTVFILQMNLEYFTTDG